MFNSTILETIGQTPLVRLNHVCPNPEVTMLAKLEGFNPSGSIKDRIALSMITAAEESGALTKDKIIIEATSGNTGIGLAMVGAVKGYRVIIAMSSAVSVERRRILKGLGADVILTPGELGTDGAVQKVRAMIADNPDAYFYPNQYANPNNPGAHIHTTAREIWEQSAGKVTHLVCALGTSGTLLGVGEGLKHYNPSIRLIEAQPVKGHGIQGLKNMEEAIIPPIYAPEKIDRHIMVETEPALACAREIMAKEGILCGMSSGAALYAAQVIAREIPSGTIVMVFADRGEKYLSTELFDF